MSKTAKALRKAPIFTPYVVVWSTCGLMALGYLGVSLLAPDWLDDLRRQPAALTAGDAGKLTAELSGLRNSVLQVQSDVARLRSDAEGQAQQTKTLAQQVTSIEQRLSPQPAPRVEAKAAPAAVEPAAGQQQVKVLNITPAAAPPPASAPALETGSVAKPVAVKAAKPVTDAISFGPATVSPAARPVGVQLSSGESVDSLRLSWSLLSDRHADALKNLQARYVAGGDAYNPNYDLVAGPVKSKAEAEKICRSLAARNVACKVGEFTGDAL